MSVYEDLGVRPIVNAKGPATRLSGGIMRPEVAAAMAEASSLCVEILELQARASAIIAQHTGAEAGLVTNGAAAALLLGTAACITGLDPAAMARLPDLRGLKDEVVMVRSQRNQYDHAVRATGARIVEVGLADRYAGAGVRDCEPWEIEVAIGERTAAVHYVADAESRPALEAVVEVAHAHKVPVVVDAAAQLPPAGNLQRFIATGADLVAFSGGKVIGGPQASGILCGRRDLIAAAALQMLDMDYPDVAFRPPSAFIDRQLLRGLPPHGIGRSAKVGKEQVVGLLTALQLFAAEGDEARTARWRVLLEEVQAAAGALSGATLTLRAEGQVPVLLVEPHPRRLPALELYRQLLSGEPAIHLDPADLASGRLRVNPICMRPADVSVLARRLKELLG